MDITTSRQPQRSWATENVPAESSCRASAVYYKMHEIRKGTNRIQPQETSKRNWRSYRTLRRRCGARFRHSLRWNWYGMAINYKDRKSKKFNWLEIDGGGSEISNYWGKWRCYDDPKWNKTGLWFGIGSEFGYGPNLMKMYSIHGLSLFWLIEIQLN